MLSLFDLLLSLLSRINGGESQSVPASDADSTLTSTSAPTPTEIPTRQSGDGVLHVIRNPNLATMDALFGRATWNDEFVCYSMERTAVAISEGVYTAQLDKSPHLGYVCPHLKVPERDTAAGGDEGILVHIANEPAQVEGCIALGTRIDGDALDSSKLAFDKMMGILPQEFTVEITSL